MLRNPITRTSSSWWYKNHCYKKINNTCPLYKKQIDEGIKTIDNIEKCYIKNKINISNIINEISSENIPIKRNKKDLLDLCPISLMIPPDMTIGSSHVGKSIYIYQLLHWYNKIPSSQIYVLLLESYIKNPVYELEMLFKWLDIEIYGEKGFESPEHLYNLTKTQYNTHPILPHILQTQVNPLKEKLHKFYQPYIKYLQQFYYLIHIKNNKLPNKSPIFTGNWSDFVHEMETYHLFNQN